MCEMTSVDEWIKNESESVLREVGIKSGQTILDFGCGSGVYTFIASKIVGREGKIYALDSDEEGLLKDLNNKIIEENLENIEIIKTSGEINIPLKEESVDIVLVFDVFHLLDQGERKKLIKEARRVLKKGGFLSYHATHIGGGYNINLEEIHSRMEKNNLILKEKFEKPMFHWAWIEDSQIFNYCKITRSSM